MMFKVLPKHYIHVIVFVQRKLFEKTIELLETPKATSATT